MTITINPVITTTAAGSFSVTLDGLVQGMAMDDPSSRNWLSGGQLAQTETLPMVGGIPITETVPVPPVAPAVGPQHALQNIISRATTAANMTGISVFNQNWSAINSPQSPVPLLDPGMLVNFYRFGTNARIPLNLNPAAVITGLVITTPLFWDAANQWVHTVAAGLIALPLTCRVLDYNIGNSMTVAYNAATGFATWVRNGNTILVQI
jgi:hypothetical protein